MESNIAFPGCGTFTPEMTAAMSTAFDSAWEQLAAAGRVETMPFRAAMTRDRMASSVIEAARKGITDPGVLVAVALTTVLGERGRRRMSSVSSLSK